MCLRKFGLRHAFLTLYRWQSGQNSGNTRPIYTFGQFFVMRQSRQDFPSGFLFWTSWKGEGLLQFRNLAFGRLSEGYRRQVYNRQRSGLWGGGWRGGFSDKMTGIPNMPDNTLVGSMPGECHDSGWKNGCQCPARGNRRSCGSIQKRNRHYSLSCGRPGGGRPSQPGLCPQQRASV